MGERPSAEGDAVLDGPSFGDYWPAKNAAPVETLAERDARLRDWLTGIRPGDIVTVRLNSTDTLTGKVYEAPDSTKRTALYVNTTLLRHGNGYPGASFEPVAASHPTPPAPGDTTEAS